MVGTPDVDHLGEAARELRAVIGDVIGEIGVAAIRLQQRPVDIVAEFGGAEQGLLAVLPIRVLLALGRRQAALIDQVSGPQILDRLVHGIGIAVPALQRALREEDLVNDAKRGEIVADHRHHAVDRRLAHGRQPVPFGLAEQGLPVLARQRLADRDEIIAGIEPFGDRTDLLAQRLAITQEGRAGENVDLRAGVVDVVFAGDIVTGESEQCRQGIAEDRAAAMADMHRPGRIRRDIFDIDLRLRLRPAATMLGSGEHRRFQNRGEHGGLQRNVDEARPGDLGLEDIGVLGEFGDDQLGERTRRHAGLLGEHHGGVDRKIAMGRILRRLDHDPRQRKPGGDAAGLRHSGEDGGEARGESLENIHGDQRFSTEIDGFRRIDRPGPIAATEWRQTAGDARRARRSRSSRRYSRRSGGPGGPRRASRSPPTIRPASPQAWR